MDTDVNSESKDTEPRRIRQLSHTLPEDNRSLRIFWTNHEQAVEPGKCAKLK